MSDIRDLKTPLQRLLEEKTPAAQPHQFNAPEQLAIFKERDALAFQKEAERDLIRLVYAPMRLSGRDNIIKSHREKIEETAKETKTAIKNIADQIDSAIKGRFSKKIKATVKEKVRDYDDI